ncbi:MAG: single-stranded DNA-binding protein [Acidobacteria bacterium]|nr:single-stranded DNA-binding protein [Acidobacteriota bacterium]
MASEQAFPRLGSLIALAGARALMDKIQSANQLNAFLNGVVKHAGLKVKYRITVDPEIAEDRDWERPEILVEFAGPDSSMLLERGAELLRSLELLAIEILRLAGNEHEKISFDCLGHRKARLEELRLSARVAADKVRQTGSPYHFAPMSSRERRILHLALRDEQDLTTESSGEGLRRSVVLYPKDYRPLAGRR